MVYQCRFCLWCDWTDWVLSLLNVVSHLKVIFKAEVFENAVLPQAKAIDDRMTSQSITGRRDLPDYDVLDAMIASALKKLLTLVHF